MTKINQNLLRKPAKKLDEITDEMWLKVNEDSRNLVEEFLEVNSQLSPRTRKQYISCLRQFFWFVYEKLHNKPFNEISKRDFMRYMSYMQERGLSSNSIGLRKSSVSSFCNYIENIVAEDIEKYKNFRNFTRGMPPIAKNAVYEKIAITEDEYNLMIKELEEKEDYLGCAWVATMFNVGCRRSELIQFKTEILNYEIPKGQNYVLSNLVRGKGKGIDGKPLRYMINLEALKYMKLWVENRQYEHEYIFVTKYDSKISPISTTWGNVFCQDILSPIVGRRINPHLFKASLITRLLDEGKSMEVISKYVAQHSNISTTSDFYDLRDFEDEKNSIFD